MSDPVLTREDLGDLDPENQFSKWMEAIAEASKIRGAGPSVVKSYLRMQYRGMGFRRIYVRKDGRVNATMGDTRYIGLRVVGIGDGEVMPPGFTVKVTFSYSEVPVK